MPWSLQMLANPIRNSSVENNLCILTPENCECASQLDQNWLFLPTLAALCVCSAVCIRSSVGAQWAFCPRLRLLNALNVFLEEFGIVVLQIKMVCCWTLVNWCMPTGIHLFLLTYRRVLRYGQTELDLSTSLAFCGCMLSAFVIRATFSFSLCVPGH